MRPMTKSEHLGAITGTLLGDSYSFKYNCLEAQHSAKQHKYAVFKGELLSKLGEHKYSVYCYYRKHTQRNKRYPMTCIQIHHSTVKRVRQQVYIKEGKGGRKITPGILQQLGMLGLALWYMDDGHLFKGRKKNGKIHARTIVWSTQSFNKEDQELFLNWLFNKYKVHGYLIPDPWGSGWRIKINATNALRLFDIIGPYIPESMKYKIDMEYVRKPQTKYEVCDIVRTAWKHAEADTRGLPPNPLPLEEKDEG